MGTTKSRIQKAHLGICNCGRNCLVGGYRVARVGSCQSKARQDRIQKRSRPKISLVSILVTSKYKTHQYRSCCEWRCHYCIDYWIDTRMHVFARISSEQVHELFAMCYTGSPATFEWLDLVATTRIWVLVVCLQGTGCVYLQISFARVELLFVCNDKFRIFSVGLVSSIQKPVD